MLFPNRVRGGKRLECTYGGNCRTVDSNLPLADKPVRGKPNQEQMVRSLIFTHAKKKIKNSEYCVRGPQFAETKLIVLHVVVLNGGLWVSGTSLVLKKKKSKSQEEEKTYIRRMA